MATKPPNTSAFIQKLLAPLPPNVNPKKGRDAFLQQMERDAKAANDIRDVCDHIARLRGVVADTNYEPLQREMAQIVLNHQLAFYAEARWA